MRIKNCWCIGLWLIGILTARAAVAENLEPQAEVNLTQDIASGELRSHGHGWLLDTDTGEKVLRVGLGGDHTIEESGGGGTVLTRIPFSNRTEYEAVARAANYTLGECYQGTLLVFFAMTINPPRARSSEVCAQLPPSTDSPDLNQDPTCECAVFESLVLWTDLDHDGVSQPWEMSSLQDSGIEAVSLDYHLSRRKDPHGNWFRWAGHLLQPHGQRPTADVIFVSE